MGSRSAVPAAFAVLLATILAARISDAGSWSPSLRMTGGLSTPDDLTGWLGLTGHVVHDDAWIRPGIEGGWWEQLGHTENSSRDGSELQSAFTGVYPYQSRHTNFLMGAIVQLSPAQDRAPVYLVLGVADLVVVEKFDFLESPTKSVWGHAPTLSAGFGYAVTHGFGQNVEARWYWRGEESDRFVPNRYFTLSAGVRF